MSSTLFRDSPFFIHCFIGSNRVCGMDEFAISVSAVVRDKKDKEVLEVIDDLAVSVDDQQVGNV